LIFDKIAVVNIGFAERDQEEEEEKEEKKSAQTPQRKKQDPQSLAPSLTPNSSQKKTQ